MKTLKPLYAVLAAAAFVVSAQARADDQAAAPRTRAEVRAETAEAIRVGDIPSYVDNLTMAQLHPEWYKAERAKAAIAKADEAVGTPVASSAK